MGSSVVRFVVQRVIRPVAALWLSLQVELHGQYSVRRLEALDTYCRTTSLLRVLAMCVLAPLPCLVLVTLTDVVPVADPQRGINANYVFWARNWITVSVISVTVLQQFRTCLPRLPLSTRSIAVITVAATFAGVGGQFCWAHVIGFPLPFGLVVGTFTWTPTLVMGCSLLWGRCLLHDASQRSDVLHYLVVFLCQISITLIYPAYIYIFNALSPSGQTAFILVLPAIKIGTKNWISRFLWHLDDHKPEVVIFNIEIFNALYIACSMQNASSPVTTAAIMAVDFIQAGSRSFLQDPAVRDHPHLRCAHLKRYTRVQVSPEPLGKQEEKPMHSLAAIVPTSHEISNRQTPANAWTDDALTLDERVAFVRRTTRMLFITEFVLLVEFTEVMMPIVYSLYVAAMSHLQNRQYYPQLATMSDAKLAMTLANVLAYALLELGSFVVLAVLFDRKLQLSSFHQLAFVLDTQASDVQSKLLLWTFYVVQSMLFHFGVDFSMCLVVHCLINDGRILSYLRPSPPRDCVSCGTRASRCLTTSFAVWEAWQVELSGYYSSRRVHAFRAYAHKTSMLRVALVCIATPLPTLALATIFEIIPLRHPSAGINANYVFWIRAYLAVFFISVGILEQFRHCLPRLPLSTTAMVGVSVLASNVGVGFQFACANMIGFPVPFAPIFGASLWAVALLIGCYVLWGPLLRQSATLRTELLEYVVVFACQCSLTVVYPAYIFFFQCLDGGVQNAFVVVLTLVKIGMRNWIRRFLRNDDLVSEIVIFNIDVFHALYVSCSLQAGTSARTTAVVMVIDVLQAVVTVNDIRHLLRRLQPLLDKANGSSTTVQYATFLDLTAALLDDPHVTTHATLQPPPVPTRYAFRSVHPTTISVSPTTLDMKPRAVTDDTIALTLDERVAFVRTASKLLFLTEFIALVEFIEVVLPLVYAVYSVAMSNLPNRAFYPRLAQLPEDQLYEATQGVVAYVGMEMVAFLVFTVGVGRWIGVSLLHQVAFVLETHASDVQAKLLIWLFFVIQSMLMHFGVDFSMKFEWLQYNWRHVH